MALTTVFWINPDSGDWGTPGNWSTGQLPGPDDEVVIDVSDDITVTHSGGTSRIRRLTSKEALVLSGGSLILEAASVIDNEFRLTWPGVLSGGGDLTVNGALLWDGGTMSGMGRTVATSELTVSTGGVKTLDGRTLDNAGMAVWNATDLFRTVGAATLNNLPGALLEAHANAALGGSGLPARFHNSGTLRKATGIGIMTIGLAFSNDGVVEVLSGRLNLGVGTSSGEFSVAARATLDLTGHTLTGSAHVTGEGNLMLSGTNFLAGAFTLTGLATLVDGTLTVSSDVTFTSLTLAAGTLEGAGNVTVAVACNWIDATIRGQGRFTSLGTLTLSGNGTSGRPRLGSGRIFDNAGTAIWIATTLLEFETGATFNNLAGATFDIQTNADFERLGPLFPPVTAFTNAGTFRKSDSAYNLSIRVPFHNTGLVEVEEGSLVFLGGGTASGTFSVATHARLSVTQFGYTFGPSSRITGPGSVRFLGDSSPDLVIIEGDYDLTGPVFIYGVVQFVRDVTLGEVTMYRGGLFSRGLLTVNGPFLWAGGLLSGAGRIRVDGELTIIAGGLAFLELGSVNLDVASHAIWQSGDITTAGRGGFVNILVGATFDISGGTWARNLADMTGTFHIRGTLRQLGGFTRFDMAVVNEGVIEVRSGPLWLTGPFTNFSRETATLTGGSYHVANTFLFTNANLRMNAANLTLDGPFAQVVDQAGGDALAAFTSNMDQGTLALQNGRSLTVAAAFINSGTVSVDALSAFRTAGTYTQLGGVTQLLGGVLTATTVDLRGGIFEGAGRVQGNFRNAGQLDVGGPLTAGSLRITGDYTQTKSGVLNLEIGGLVPGAAHDQLIIDGLAALDGTLNIALLDDFFPEIGDVFQILLFGTRQGEFAAVKGLELGDGFFFEPSYEANGIGVRTRFQP